MEIILIAIKVSLAVFLLFMIIFMFYDTYTNDLYDSDMSPFSVPWVEGTSSGKLKNNTEHPWYIEFRKLQLKYFTQWDLFDGKIKLKDEYKDENGKPKYSLPKLAEFLASKGDTRMLVWENNRKKHLERKYKNL